MSDRIGPSPTPTGPPRSCYASLVDFGEYDSCLTAGENPTYALPRELGSRLVIVDRGARQAQIVVTDPPDAWLCDDTDLQLRALTSRLRADGFVVLPQGAATHSVLLEVMRNPSPRAAPAYATHADGAPMRVFLRWIDCAEQMGASDLHVEVRGTAAQARARVDGDLEPLADGRSGQYTRSEAQSALAAGFNASRTGNSGPHFEAEKFLDCMLPLQTSRCSGQLRYQLIPGRLGPKAVIRLLRGANHGGAPSTSTLTWTRRPAPAQRAAADTVFQAAGYAPSQRTLWRRAASTCSGLIVIGGRTGSGKSTSQKHFIETLPGLERRAVYTVEDPIEYEIAGAHQTEVIRDTADEEGTQRRYANVFKALMRADPDACFIGEIRDRLTAGFALQMAQTGHLSVGTLHVHHLSSVAPRLCSPDVGLSRQALTSPGLLNLLVYQDLIPLLCPRCAVSAQDAAPLDPDTAVLTHLLDKRFSAPTQALKFRHPHGCEACRWRGTLGRTIAAEMWQPDSRWLDLVREQDDVGALAHYRSFSDRDLLSEDMSGKTIFEHVLHKALHGQVDPRECERFDSFERFELQPTAARRLHLVADTP